MHVRSSQDKSQPSRQKCKMNGLLLPRQAGDSPCVRSGLEARPCLVVDEEMARKQAAQAHTPREDKAAH